ncbi:MAG: trans-2-enoyl-CoA reductase family protein [Lentisphaerae bacterium]|jgi:enoyl-[acyl-carrier protein] reductase/trans-2-enoyl-CoA reductase (NAD+)|nr:trans-2-enoyl-CoA reductase family protein [Lentisphaerota bacterium]
MNTSSTNNNSAIAPKIRNGICFTINPEGLARMVQRQITAARKLPPLQNPPKSVLVLGCSGGYGLSSRIIAACTGGADTFGVSFERSPGDANQGTPGWYNNLAFDNADCGNNSRSITLVGDAFLPEVKTATIKQAQEAGFAPFDTVIYSLAAPQRKDPHSDTIYRSAIRPIGEPFRGITINVGTGHVVDVVINPATEEEIKGTIKVMGGEDWELWLQALNSANMLAPGVKTVAFSYIGPSCTWPIYRSGTLGRAKAHLDQSARSLQQLLAPLNGTALVSVNKALVTRASSVIPAMPPYISALYAEMKERGLHEGCFEQAVRLFRDRLCTDGPIPVDAEGRIRLDDWEMLPEVQQAVARRLEGLTNDNLHHKLDFKGYLADFLELHGFDSF